jgi:hypothetical protein
VREIAVFEANAPAGHLVDYDDIWTEAAAVEG